MKEGEVLLLRRFQTGYEDGNYSVPAGHIDGNERATTAMLREAKEEIGVVMSESDIQMVHVMHRISPVTHPSGGDERIDFFFATTTWGGEPRIMEPDKCDDLCWSPMDQLPQNVIPYVKSGLAHYRNGVPFSEFGWGA